MKILTLALLVLLMAPLAGCEKSTEDQGTKTLEAKMAAEEALWCYKTPQGWVQKTVSGQVLSCEEAANNGDVNAQFSLALVSDMNGELIQSAKWFRMAAEQGQSRSQLMLGAMHANGSGVPKDLVLAYMWTTISYDVMKLTPSRDLSKVEKQKFLEQGNALEGYFVDIFSRLELQMTASQIVQAKALAKACRGRSFKGC